MVLGGVVVDIGDNMNDIDKPLVRYIIMDITFAVAYFLFAGRSGYQYRKR